MDIKDLFKLTDPAPVCCGTGLVALDIVYPKKDTISPELYAGGSCGNVLAILAHFGWVSYPFARLKDDVFSEILVNDFQRWKVKTDFISKSEQGSTPIIIEKISRNKNNEPFHTFSITCPNCGSFLPQHKPVLARDIKSIINKLPKPFVFYFDRVSRGSIQLAQEFKNRGALIFFEPPRIKNEKIFKECLMLTDILKYSDVTKEDHPSILKDADIPLKIKTMGSKGIEYSYMDDMLDESNRYMDAFPINRCVDAAGAGDWCSAGILHALEKCNIQSVDRIDDTLLSEILAFGQALAALNCHYYSARGSMYHMTLTELESIVIKLLCGEEYAVPKRRIKPIYSTNNTGTLCPKCPCQQNIL